MIDHLCHHILSLHMLFMHFPCPQNTYILKTLSRQVFARFHTSLWVSNVTGGFMPFTFSSFLSSSPIFTSLSLSPSASFQKIKEKKKEIPILHRIIWVSKDPGSVGFPSQQFIKAFPPNEGVFLTIRTLLPAMERAQLSPLLHIAKVSTNMIAAVLIIPP